MSNKEQTEQVKPEFAVIKVETLNACLQYLASQPYGQVADLIKLVQEAQFVDPTSQMEEVKGEAAAEVEMEVK